MSRGVDGRHARDEHGEDQERADLHDELQAVRHALCPHRTRGGARPAQLRELRAHRPRKHGKLGRVTRDRRVGGAAHAPVETEDEHGVECAHRRSAVTDAVLPLAQRCVQEHERRAERTDREVLGGEVTGAR
jgi:hypothetical protein